MQRVGWILALAAFAAGFGAGRLGAQRAASPCDEIATLASFERGLLDPDWIARTWRISGYLQTLGPENLDESLALLERERRFLDQDELRLFMDAWVRFDPPAAFERTLGWSGPARAKGAAAAIYAYAYHDPQGALRALAAVKEPALAQRLERRLVAGWARGPHRLELDAHLATLSDDKQRESFVGGLAFEVAKQGGDALVAWAEAVPEVVPSYKSAVFRKAAGMLASLDAPRAGRWVDAHREREYARGAVRVVAVRWIESDPAATFAWLRALPPGAERDAAVADAFAEWLERAPQPATEWLSGQEPETGLDPAVRVVVRRIHPHAPADALHWTQRIASAELRAQVQVAVGRAWLLRAPAAARAGIADSELPPEVREQILESSAAAP